MRKRKVENIFCPKAPTENGSRIKEQRLTCGVHMSGSNPRRRPKDAVVAGVEPRRVREIGVYQEVQRVLSRRWLVDLGVGEHHIDGYTFSGGRRLGRWWGTPVGAANSELKRGSGEWMHREATGKS